jgi:hypothetical protein
VFVVAMVLYGETRYIFSACIPLGVYLLIKFVVHVGFGGNLTKKAVMMDLMLGIFEIAQIGFICQYFRVGTLGWQEFSLAPFQIFLVGVKTVSMVLFWGKVQCVTGGDKSNYIGGAEVCGV